MITISKLKILTIIGILTSILMIIVSAITMLFGALASMTIIGLIIGIPMLISGGVGMTNGILSLIVTIESKKRYNTI